MQFSLFGLATAHFCLQLYKKFSFFHTMKTVKRLTFCIVELPVFKVWKVTTEVESVTIHYKVKNNASSVNDIKWTTNGEELDFQNQKYVGGGLLDSYLRITSPNEADKGTYSCTLTNAVGCTSKDVIFGNVRIYKKRVIYIENNKDISKRHI